MSMYDGSTYEGAVLYSSFVPHLKVQTVPFGESKTRQEFADECDINSVMRRFEKHKVLTHVNRSQGRYLDVSDVPDLQTALTVMADAESAFNSLPAKVRAEFENDPVSFVTFAQDSKNLDKLREWGLAKPVEAPPAPMRVEVINPAIDEPSDAPKPSRAKSKAD